VVRFRVDGPDAELVSSTRPGASRAAPAGHDPGGTSSHACARGQAGPGPEEGRCKEVHRQEGAGAEGGQEVGSEGGQEVGPEGGKTKGEAQADGAEARPEGVSQEEAPCAGSGQT